MTTLHSGGKFDSKVYETSGGLHGVGVSVVNALSDMLEVEVARGRQLYRQRFSRGVPQGKLEHLGEVHNRRGTRTRFHPDPQIFKGHVFEPARLWRAQGHPLGGVNIRWSCDPPLMEKDRPRRRQSSISRRRRTISCPLGDEFQVTRGVRRQASVRAATDRWSGLNLVWRRWFRQLLLQHHRPAGARTKPASPADARPMPIDGQQTASIVTSEDVMISAAGIFRCLSASRSSSAARPAGDYQYRRDGAPRSLRPLAGGQSAGGVEASEWVIAFSRRARPPATEKEISCKSAVRKLRLWQPADCTRTPLQAPKSIVEGDSAGASTGDRAMSRPLRGKILNVASAGSYKLAANQQISTLQALAAARVQSRRRSGTTV